MFLKKICSHFKTSLKIIFYCILNKSTFTFPLLIAYFYIAMGGEFMDSFFKGIALQSAGIAHILNAEGEKIQLAVAKNVCVSDLLEINASVACTIEDIMWLEFVSYHKLKTVLCCDCDCFKQKKQCGKNCDSAEKVACKKVACDKPRCEKSVVKKIYQNGKKGKNQNCCDKIEICGRVYNKNGEPCKGGFVTAKGHGVKSCDICFDGKYFLKDVAYCDTITINACSHGNADGFLLRSPDRNFYQIDMFL